MEGEQLTCVECGRHFPRRNDLGRKPRYCGRLCQQKAYRRRYVERMREKVHR